MSKKILIVVDMQKDFIDGALGTKEAVAIVDNVCAKIESALHEGTDVVFTKDCHHEDYMNTVEGSKLPVPHCIKGTDGFELDAKLKKYEGTCPIFEKPTFGSLDLAGYLVKNTYREIELIGLCTDICVISNALLIKANLPESLISVDASCCAGVTPESHNNALSAMKMCHIDVINI